MSLLDPPISLLKFNGVKFVADNVTVSVGSSVLSVSKSWCGQSSSVCDLKHWDRA